MSLHEATALGSGPHNEAGTLLAAALAASYVPPSVLVGARGQILSMFGDVAPFLKARGGRADVLPAALALPELGRPVADLMEGLGTPGVTELASSPVQVELAGRVRWLRVVGRRLPVQPGEASANFALSFEPHTHPETQPPYRGPASSARLARASYSRSSTRCP